jgi:hypothetical protein
MRDKKENPKQDREATLSATMVGSWQCVVGVGVVHKHK